MAPRRRTARLICGSDLHAFAFVIALVIFLTFSVVMTLPTASPYENWGSLPRIHHAKVLGAWAWGANRDDAIIVTVTRDGRVYFRTDAISAAQLSEQLRECSLVPAERH